MLCWHNKNLENRLFMEILVETFVQKRNRHPQKGSSSAASACLN